MFDPSFAGNLFWWPQVAEWHWLPFAGIMFERHARSL